MTEMAVRDKDAKMVFWGVKIKSEVNSKAYGLTQKQK